MAEKIQPKKIERLEELKDIESFKEAVLIREYENDSDVQLLLIHSDGASYIYGISRFGSDAILEVIYDLPVASCINGGIRYVSEKYSKTLFRPQKITRKFDDYKFIIYDQILKRKGV